MPLGPDPARAAVATARLDRLREVVAAAEDDVLACLVVTGEPRAQRVLDDWLDQVADALRALGESAGDLSAGIARAAAGGTRPGEASQDRTTGGEASAPALPWASGVKRAAGDGPGEGQ